MNHIVWVKFRINSRAHHGAWQWKPVAVSSKKAAKEEVRHLMKEMISEEALHSEYGRSGDWDILKPPQEEVVKIIDRLTNDIVRKQDWIAQLKEFVV